MSFAAHLSDTEVYTIRRNIRHNHNQHGRPFVQSCWELAAAGSVKLEPNLQYSITKEGYLAERTVTVCSRSYFRCQSLASILLTKCTVVSWESLTLRMPTPWKP